MRKKFNLLLVLTIVMSMFLFTACGNGNDDANAAANNNNRVEDAENHNHNNHNHNHNDADDAEEAEDLELSEWNGEWNSIDVYADEADVQDAYKEVAERDDITEEEAKENFRNTVKVDFGAMKVEDNMVAFLDAPEGEEIDKAEYTYVDKHAMEHGGKTFYWYEFKSEGKFPILLLMPVHGEDHMPHFHLRVGDDVESMLEKEDWYPTFVSPTVTLDQVYEEIAE